MEFVTIGPDFVASGLEPYLHSAAELGARRVSVCGDDPDLSRLADRLGEVCRLAASYGMGVDVEWMAWRAVSTLQDAVKIVQGCGEPNCALLIDALHLDRTGATPADVAALPPGLVRSVQLCDAPAARPGDMAATLLEARAGRLPPGEGALPIRDLLAAAPRDAMLSVEVPTTSSCPPEDRVRHIFESTQRLLAERVITRRAKPEDRDDRR
jgi:sugar phosphate isomerase/epimerase